MNFAVILLSALWIVMHSAPKGCRTRIINVINYSFFVYDGFTLTTNHIHNIPAIGFPWCNFPLSVSEKSAVEIELG